MKNSRIVSAFSTFLMAVGLLTFIPTIEAEANANCVGANCTQTFNASASAQNFTPPAPGVMLRITVNGAGGSRGGGDAGGGGGAGIGGNRIAFDYVATSTNPLYLYIGNAGGVGAGGSCSGAGAAGTNPWTAYNGGRGGFPGCSGSSGAGGGGGSATVISTGDKTGVIAVAGGGAGGGGANINANGTAGKADTGAQNGGTTGAPGQDWGGDGSGGGGGGGGATGGTGGTASADGWSPGGQGGVTGRNLVPAQSNSTVTSNANAGAGSITISWPNGPAATTRPSFTDNATAIVGQVLVPATGTYLASAGTVTVSNPRWQISTDGSTWTDISPTVTGDYTVKPEDAGKYVRFAEDATDSNSTLTWASTASLQITGVPAFTAETLSGTSAGTVLGSVYAGYTFQASGLRNTFSISEGALPGGITLNPTTGAISGTSTTTGIFKFKVRVTNEAGSDETEELTITVGRAPVFTSDDSILQSVNRVTNPIRVGAVLPNFVFAANAFPAATFELKTDSTTLPNCGTAPNCAYTFETRALPPGLTFDAATGTLSGTPTQAGAYVFAIQANNSVGSSIDTIHMTVARRAANPFTLTSDKSSVVIVQNTTVTATITAAGGDGNGAFSFAVDPSSAAICSVVKATDTTATMTVTTAGNCVINGTKAADGGFAASRSSITIPINKAAQVTPIFVQTAFTAPLVFGTNVSQWINGAGGNGTGTYTYALDPSSVGICTVGTLSGISMYVTYSTTGTCSYLVTKAGDAFFLPQTIKYTVEIIKGTQAALAITNPGSSNWHATNVVTHNLATSGGSGTGAVTYFLDPTVANACTLNGNVLTARNAGTCTVTAIKAADANYNQQSAAPVTWTINQIAQTALAYTMTTSNGASFPWNGGTTYVANPTPIVTINVTGGSGTGSFSYVATGNSGCVVQGAGSIAYVYVAPTGAGLGSCFIAISKAGDVNFTVATTNTQFSFSAAPQAPLVATAANPSMDFVATTLTDASTAAKTQITVTGGLGTGAITYVVPSGSTSVCTVSSTGLITNRTAGSCVVNVTKAADSNYQVQTTSVTVTFNKLNQPELVANPADASEPFVWSPKATNQITTTGGAGTGAVTYAVDPSTSTVCSVGASNGLITNITAGTCLVNVTKAADTNYNVATDQVSVVFTKIDPAAITLTAAPTSLVYTPAANKNQTWVTIAGGTNSTGANTFFVDPMTEENCSIATVQATRVLVNGNLAGFCLIAVVKAGDVNYNEIRTMIGFEITKMVQTIAATSSAGTSPWFKVSPDVTTTINVTGQQGTGTTRFVVDPANSTSNCAIDQATGNVTSPTVGTCRITVTRDGDDNVQASNSVVLNLSITKINQAVITLTPETGFKLAPVGSPQATSPLTLGLGYTGTGNFTRIVSTTPLICTITGGGDSTLTPPTFTATTNPSITVTAINDGTCTLQYTKLADVNFNVATNATASFIIGKATQAEFNASITAGSESMAFVMTPKVTATVTGTGGSGTGAINYTVAPASSTICSVNLTTGVVTNITAGVCVINVRRLTDNDFAESETRLVTITFTKIDQAPLVLAAAKTTLRATTSALDTTTLSTTGGLGTGAVTYAVDPSSVGICSISGTTVTGLGAGDCNITATKAADVNYNVATSTLKLTVAKGNQAALVVNPYWATIGYVPPTPADASLVNAFVWSGGTGAGELVFTIDPASAEVCNRAGMRPGVPSHIQVFALGSGTCTISVFKSGGTAWENSNTVVSSFTITKIAQAAITATPSRTSIPFFDAPANTFTVAVTGGSGEGLTSVSINPASAAICSDATVTGGVITVRTLGVGNCLLSGVKAASPGYTQVTSAQITVTITKGTQTPIVMSASPSELIFAVSPRATSTLTVTGGSGNGAMTVSVDSGSTAICTYDAATGLITAIQAGRCELTATKAAGADGLFNAATGKLTVVINKIPQARLNLTAVTPFITFVEDPKQTTALNLTGGSGTGAVTYAVQPGSASVCTLAVANGVATVTANYFGFCVITATKAGDVNYAEATATTTVRISQPGTQIIATVPNATESFVPAPGFVTTVTVEGSEEGDILSYSVDADSRNICSVSGTGTTAKVTALGQGECNVIAINVARAPDGTLIASSSVATFTITKGAQLDVVATPDKDKINFAVPAATNVITVTGGVLNSTITATVDPASAEICSVTVAGNKITMTALQVGDCKINIAKEGNAGFLDYETSITVPVLKTKQADLFVTATPAELTYSATDVVTTTLSTVGGSGTGAVTYEVTEASASICSVTGNVVTVITGGDCVVLATKAGDVNFAEAIAAVTIKIAKGDQAALEVEAADETLQYVLGETVQTALSTTGGSGDGAITYAVAEDSALICELDGTNVVVLKAGTCVITATKASDAFFKEVTGTVTIIIAKGVQAEFTVDTRDESIQYLVGSLVRTELLPSGGSGSGVVSYTVHPDSLSVCALQGSDIVALRAGSCTITANKASDSNFLATSASTTIEITKSPQVPLVLESDDETLAYIVNTSVTTRLSITGGSGVGAVVYAVAESSTSVCSIAGNVVTALTSGNCELTVTKASDANYLEATDSLVITITKGLQAALTVTAANPNLAYSPTDVVTTTLSTVGGSGEGAVTYAVSPASASICSVEGNVVTVITGGDCVVVATKAGDVTFEPATANATIKIAKGTQAALLATADDETLQYVLGETVQTDLSTTGGSGTGAVSYAVAEASAAICSVDGNTVTALKAGTCTITATKASDAFFNAATDSVDITINKGVQTPLSLTTEDASLQHNFDTVVRTALLPTGGSGNGAITYTIAQESLLVCALQGSNIVSLRPGSCTITATKASDSDFLATSASVTVEITKANQTPLVLASEDDTLAYIVNTSVTTRLSVTGGSGNGAVSYAVAEASATVCSVSGNIVTALTSGNCELIATKASDANYLEATDSLVITITKGLQAALTASAANSNLAYSANEVTTTVSTVGGSGTGEVTYAVSPASASVCSVSGNVVTVITGGDCVIVATKAGDVTFEPATATTTIKIAKGTQAALVLSAEDETLVFNKDVPAETGLLVSGGSGDGEIEFSVAPSSAAICELDGSKIVALRAGTCVVIATKQEDAFFEAATESLTITIEKAAQEALVATTAQGHTSTPDWNLNNETQMVISGGDGFGALTVESLTPAICSVELAGSRVNVTAHAAGNCEFRVNKDGDYNYLEATALTHTMVVGTADTDLAISIKPVTTHVAGRAGSIEITVTNVSDAAAAGVTVEYTLPYGFTIGSPLPAGCSAASASLVSCTTAAVIAAGGNLKFVIPVVVPDSFDGGELTKGASAVLISTVEDSTLENNAVTGNAANFIVHRAPGEFSKSELEPMQTGVEFSDQIESVGFPAVTYSVTAGVLPAGLTLDPETGEISGTPTGFGAYSFTITATNAAGSASVVYSGSVAPIPAVTVPGSGFSTNTVPAGTRVTIVGTNLDLVTSAIIGGRSANIVTKTATQIVLDVPNSNTAATVPITLVYDQGNLVGGSFTYTGVSKLNPVIVISAGASTAGAAEAPRTLSSTITAPGAPGQITLPVIYSSKTTAVCTVTGNQLNFLTVGLCTLTATTASTALFNAGTAANVSLSVGKSDQTLNIVLPQNTVPPTKATDSADGFELTATASSNLPVLYRGTTPTICDVTEGGFVIGIKPGICVVNVSQAGNARFNPIAPTRMEFTITKDAGGPSVDPGDPSKPTSLASGKLTKMGDAAFTWNKALGHLRVETYGIWIGRISAVSEFRISGKAYKCTVNFGTLKAMPSKTAAQKKAAMAKKTFKAATPFCNSKTEAAAFNALKKGFNGLQVKVTISRFRMYPTTYKPVNAVTKKPITTQIRTVYLTLG